MEQQRKISGEREARRYLAAAAAAGGTVKEWARANGIDGRSLNAWRMNLERRGANEAPKRRPRRGAKRHPERRRANTSTQPLGEGKAMLVELVPTSRPTATAPARYAVCLGEMRLEVGDDFDAQTVRRLVEVLRGC
jgi:transposase-like protein